MSVQSNKESYTSANRRMAKNTIALYIRMAIAMLVTLYTSRVVLRTLGVEDFGTYGVVGGIVVLFAFVNNTLVSSIQRFLNFELGRNNNTGVTKVFSNAFHIQLLFAFIVVVLAETVGLYYLNNYINLPSGRLFAANCVYQLSILTTVLRIIRAPFTASVVSYERMTVFAIVGIVNVILKLLIVYLLLISPIDKLISYSILSTCVSLCITLFYFYYNQKNFPLCKINRRIDKLLLKQMLSFSGWSLLGSVAVLATYQGCDLVINYFHGVVVNAALSIANQVYAATTSFTGNFQTAFRPQITKIYARGDLQPFLDLVFKTTRYSFFLVIICATPLYFECAGLLRIWLNEYPNYTIDFCRYLILLCVIDAVAAPLAIAINATGIIKKYQIIISSIIILNLPLSIIIMLCGFSPVSVIVTRFIVYLVALLYRIIYMSKNVKMSINNYFKQSVLPCIFITIPICISAFFIKSITHNVIISSILMFIISLIIIMTLGLNKIEKKQLLKYIRSKFFSF